MIRVTTTAAHPAERLSVMALDHLEQFRARAWALLAANRALLDAFLDSPADLECFRTGGPEQRLGVGWVPQVWFVNLGLRSVLPFSQRSNVERFK
jgi:hypothetical protein